MNMRDYLAKNHHLRYIRWTFDSRYKRIFYKSSLRITKNTINGYYFSYTKLLSYSYNWCLMSFHYASFMGVLGFLEHIFTAEKFHDGSRNLPYSIIMSEVL
jgi:hypothetical protein